MVLFGATSLEYIQMLFTVTFFFSSTSRTLCMLDVRQSILRDVRSAVKRIMFYMAFTATK